MNEVFKLVPLAELYLKISIGFHLGLVIVLAILYAKKLGLFKFRRYPNWFKDHLYEFAHMKKKIESVDNIADRAYTLSKNNREAQATKNELKSLEKRFEVLTLQIAELAEDNNEVDEVLNSCAQSIVNLAQQIVELETKLNQFDKAAPAIRSEVAQACANSAKTALDFVALQKHVENLSVQMHVYTGEVMNLKEILLNVFTNDRHKVSGKNSRNKRA